MSCEENIVRAFEQKLGGQIKKLNCIVFFREGGEGLSVGRERGYDSSFSVAAQ